LNGNVNGVKGHIENNFFLLDVGRGSSAYYVLKKKNQKIIYHSLLIKPYT